MAWQKREKTPRYNRKKLIRRSLDIFSSEKMRDDFFGGNDYGRCRLLSKILLIFSLICINLTFASG